MDLKPIQWFPGHMNKARKELVAIFKHVDVFIEVLDARIPFSSQNPMLEELQGGKPCLRVLAKNDLADAAVNAQWLAYFNADKNAQTDKNSAIVLDARNKNASGRIVPLCRDLFARKGVRRSNMTAMVVGIPNVGKSTLINSLAGRAVAKTGDQPAITKQQQFIEINADFRLLDTPGLMWPKVENIHSGYRLAITGAIMDTALSHIDVARYALQALFCAYPEKVSRRYGLKGQSDHFWDGFRDGFRDGFLDNSQDHSLGALAEVGRRRGCLVRGGHIDLDRAAKIVLADLRAGRLGRISWETPGDIEREAAEILDKMKS